MSGPGHVYLASTSGGAFPAMVERAIASVKLRPGQRKARVAISYAAVADSFAGRTFMKGFAAKSFWGSETTAFHVAGESSKMDAAKAKAIVDEADIVFLAGGDPVLGARLLRGAGADAWLRDARARGTPCLGVSAGAMMLCAWWASWPESAAQGASGAPFEGGELVACCGVVPDIVVDCHAEDDEWAELKLVSAMLAQRAGNAPLPRRLGLPTGAGLIVGADGETSWLGAKPFEL